MVAEVRSAQFELLLSDFAAVLAGTAYSVVLEGPPGTGKRDLVEAFIECIGTSNGVGVLRDTCRRDERDVPYAAVTRLVDADPAMLEELPATLSRRLAERVLRRLDAGPLVLVLERAEWSDELSLRWLELLLQRCRHRRLMVILSQRRSILPAWRRSLDGASAVVGRRTVILGTIDDKDVKELTARWWPQTPDPGFVELCTCLSGGVPGLIEQLLADLHAAGHRPDAAGAQAAAVLGAELLAAHSVFVLAGLPAQIGQVARALALLGRADPEPVALLAGVPEMVVTRALAVLREEGMPGPDSAQFEICRSALLGGMTEEEQISGHDRAARMLNDTGGSAEEVSTHLLALPALPEPWMLGVLRDAADRAERRGDIAGAVRWRERLIAADTVLDDLIDYARVLVHLDAHEAHRLISEAITADTPVRTRAALARQYGKSAIMVGEVPAAVRVLTAILCELLPVIGTEPVNADHRLWTRTEAALLTLGWNEQATVGVISARAKAIRSPPGHNRGEREMLAVQAVTSALGGGTAAEVAVIASRAVGAENAPDSWVFAAAGYVLALAGEVDEAVGALDRVCRHGRERGQVWVQVAGLTLRARILQTSGKLSAALDDAELALDLSEGHEWGRWTSTPQLSTPRVTLASILAQQGQASTAFELLNRAEPVTDRGSVLMQPNLLMTRSAVCLAVGDRVGALDYALRCGRFLADAGVTNPLFLPWWLEAAPLLVDFGNEPQARRVVEHGTALAEHWGTPTGRGLALLAQGSIRTGTERVDTLRAAGQILATTPCTWYQAKVEFALGEALAASGDQTRADGHFRRATDLAAGGGYRLLAEAARTRTAADGDPARWPPSGGLTPSERRVANLAAKGATNREIAAALVIALRTVEIHLTSAYRKLGIAGRAELSAALGHLDRDQPGDLVENGRPGR